MKLFRVIKRAMKVLHYLFNRDADELFIPTGHYYSPIPSIHEIRGRKDRIFNQHPRSLPGIDLHAKAQLLLVRSFTSYYADIPFADTKQKGLRFYYDNNSFCEGDAVALFCMLRHLKPKHIIEIGSGFSSALMLDTNELFFDGSISCTVIDPAPDTFLSLLKNKDVGSVKLLEKKAQDVPVEQFLKLGNGDILFVDSSHVAKCGSDVLYLFSEILSRLKKGVSVHFHDVFYPFEYPMRWIEQGRAWNESYMLRAFLQGNQDYEIIWFNSFLERFHKAAVGKALPLWLRNAGGSIWIRKVR